MQFTMKKHTILLCSLLAVAAPALAQSHGHGHDSPAPAVQLAQAAAGRPQVEALVRTVDKSAKKITLKHGDIPNLDMGPMTMVFQVQDPALLDKVKAGDTVRFTADKVKGAYTVLTIEPVQK
jgi:Cu/Ag efflux protein CusF